MSKKFKTQCHNVCDKDVIEAIRKAETFVITHRSIEPSGVFVHFESLDIIKPPVTKKSQFEPHVGDEVRVINCGKDFGINRLKYMSDSYVIVQSNTGFEQHFHHNSVELLDPSDWRDRVVEHVGSGLLRRHDEGFQIGGVYLPANTLVELSHLVASMTERPQ